MAADLLSYHVLIVVGIVRDKSRLSIELKQNESLARARWRSAGQEIIRMSFLDKMHQKVEENQANHRLERLDSLPHSASDESSAAWHVLLDRKPSTWTAEEVDPLLIAGCCFLTGNCCVDQFQVFRRSFGVVFGSPCHSESL